MKSISTNQLALPFPEKSPREGKIANWHAIEQSIRERYPMTLAERSWLPEGVRLARSSDRTLCHCVSSPGFLPAPGPHCW